MFGEFIHLKTLFFVILLTLAFWTTIPPLSFNTICICINFSIAPILIVILRRTRSISNSLVNEREDTSFIVFFSTVSYAYYKMKKITFASISYSLIFISPLIICYFGDQGEFSYQFLFSRNELDISSWLLPNCNSQLGKIQLQIFCCTIVCIEDISSLLKEESVI